MMKAISLWQPWATLVAIGAKQYETRHWSTSYRGPLVIHAAKKNNGELFRVCLSDPFTYCLLDAGYKEYSGLPFGAYVAVVDLVEVIRTEEVLSFLSEQEVAFGNYLPNRFAWRLENVRVFSEPVPARGYQGLWNPLEGASPPMVRLIEKLYQKEELAQ